MRILLSRRGCFFLSGLCRIFFVTDSRCSTWFGLAVSQCRVLGIGAKERILVECGNNTHFWCKRRTPLVPPFPDPSYYCWTMPPTKVFLQRNCPLSNFGGELEKYVFANKILKHLESSCSECGLRENKMCTGNILEIRVNPEGNPIRKCPTKTKLPLQGLLSLVQVSQIFFSKSQIQYPLSALLVYLPKNCTGGEGHICTKSWYELRWQNIIEGSKACSFVSFKSSNIDAQYIRE